MKKSFLVDLKPSYEIAWELNRLGFKTPLNKLWSENTVYRILTSEVHLGKVIYGKRSSSGIKNKPNLKDRKEWIIGEGNHKRLKTEEEHKRILAILDSRRLKPVGTRQNIQVLSKLLRYGQCGGSLSFVNKPNKKCYVKTCSKSDFYGNKCCNRGINVETIYAQLFFDLQQYEDLLLKNNSENVKKDNTTLKLALENKKGELNKLETGVDRLFDLYVEGLIDKEQFKVKQDKLKKKIQFKKEEIRSIEQSLAHFETSRTDDDRLNVIKQFKEAWNIEGINRKELNKLAKEIIDRIDVIREGDNVQLKIQFL
jgi:site-specific DNA recombinase